MGKIDLFSFFRTLISSSLVIVVSAYALISLTILIFQSHFIYFPEKNIYTFPSYLGLEYEEVAFSASNKHLRRDHTARSWT